eukprot:127817-Prorocentrum_lima.AAC.1
MRVRGCQGGRAKTLGGGTRSTSQATCRSSCDLECAAVGTHVTLDAVLDLAFGRGQVCRQ